MNVLELGCGERKLLTNSVGVDIRKVKQSNMLIADATKLPFRNKVFDLTFCFETIEHISDPNKAIAEMARVTTETILITTPHKIAKIYRLFVPKEYEHERYLSLKDIVIPSGWTLLWKRSVWYQQLCLRRNPRHAHP